MSDIYELTKQFQQAKLRRTMLEMERVGREVQGLQGGLDPFTANELGKRASPYYRTRAEIDQDIASINALSADYAAAQKAVRSATTAAEKRAAEVELSRIEWETKKNTAASTTGDKRYEVDRGVLAEELKTAIDLYGEKVEGDGEKRLKAAHSTVLRTGRQAAAFDPSSDQVRTLLGTLPGLEPAEAKNLIEEYSEAAGLTPESFRKELAAKSAKEGPTFKTLVQLEKMVQDVDTRHAALVEKYPDEEELGIEFGKKVRALSAGADWGEYPGGDAAGGMTQAEWDRQRAMARAGGPFDADKRALADEVMAEDAPETPYKDSWEEYTSTPEFVKEAEGLWGKKGPFTEAEERVVFRKLKQRGRQEGGAARKEGRGLELGGRASAEAAMPAAAAETETPVTEAPEETVPEAAETLISLKGDDDFEYKIVGDDVFFRERGGTWDDMSLEGTKVLLEKMQANPGDVYVDPTGAPLSEALAAAMAEMPAPTAAPEAPVVPVAPPTVADLAQQAVLDRYDTSWMSKPLGVDEVEMLPDEEQAGPAPGEILPEEEEQAALDVAKMPEPLPQALPPSFSGELTGYKAGQGAFRQAMGEEVAKRLNRTSEAGFFRRK